MKLVSLFQLHVLMLKSSDVLFEGERANQIGPKSLFQERIKVANERLLQAGNFTGCETIETLKKAAVDYRKRMALDENMFLTCRIYRRIYQKWDKEATAVPGNAFSGR
jgi:hypothetical protein